MKDHIELMNTTRPWVLRLCQFKEEELPSALAVHPYALQHLACEMCLVQADRLMETALISVRADIHFHTVETYGPVLPSGKARERWEDFSL